MFDHWDIIDRKIQQILEVTPDDPHSLFAKAVMYGFEGVLPSVQSTDVEAAMVHLERVAPKTAGLVDRALADVKMVADVNHVQASLGTWSDENQAWLETAYGGGGRFRAIEIPMTNRDFARGAGLFTLCDFEELESSK